MSRKTLAKVAVAMLVVYGLTILLYPMLFNPDAKDRADIEAPPVPTQVIGK